MEFNAASTPGCLAFNAVGPVAAREHMGGLSVAEIHKLSRSGEEPAQPKQYMTAGLTLLTIAVSVGTGIAGTAYVLGGSMAKSEVRIDNMVAMIDREHIETHRQIAGILEAVGRLSVQSGQNTAALQTSGAQITSLVNQLESERKERIELERRLFVRPR